MNLKALAVFLLFQSCAKVLTENNFEIITPEHQATILYDEKGSDLDSIAANLLAKDIFMVTNYRPKVVNSIDEVNGNVIVIGEIQSKLVNTFLKNSQISEDFKNQWESYTYQTVANPNGKIEKAFIIAGTNPRGTAYGVFNISKKMGVNPWYWWADVPVKKSEELVLNQPDVFSKSPSVKYRGIFLNDEDWGLQPWAAKTFEPETNDIGPKTYSKIFELLLRLNANTIWPAMHPSTKAFFHYPGNAQAAKRYDIIVGTSHAEPMLRNNVDEWSKTEHGAFNYKTNQATVLNYWEERVKEAKDIDAIYTVGMRGVHDSGMEGINSKDEAVDLLEGILSAQRNLIKTHVNTKVEEVPQAFTVYKEVLYFYKNGLEVPEDITLVWTDDNYGYIRALNNTEEQKRPGGGGVYYHASYWGRPHDYLWLSTTSPYLIWEEMIKAYQLNNKTIWILNVGDIKPAEFNTQLFLDMAYDASKFENSEYIKTHQEEFFKNIFGEDHGKSIAQIKEDYYQLAFGRKPEFMGWSQTEPTTLIYNTDYSPFSNGDEIEQRVADYNNLEKAVKDIEAQLPENLKSPFVQLVSYPVEAASNMNKKFLYRDKAMAYAEQGRKSALQYKMLSHQAYENIVSLTEKYNSLSNGKWKGMMDMKPRNLPVYDIPEINISVANSEEPIGITVEDTLKLDNGQLRLPTFYANDSASYFVDVYLKSAEKASWQFSKLPKWINVENASGKLDDENLEERISFSVNWDAWQEAGKPHSETISVESNVFKRDIQINISTAFENTSENSLVEKHGRIIGYANGFTKNISKENSNWQPIKGLGHTQSVMQAAPFQSGSISNFDDAAVLEYELFAETITDVAWLTLVAIPTHPLTTSGQVRVGVQWNDNPIEIIDFKTEGRSSTWKQNVLSNTAKKQLKVSVDSKGKQTLKIYMLDAGFLLDYFVLDTMGEEKTPYRIPAETKVAAK
ncbi:hypothetical protein PK35_02870 [Tamlana nanhaiensis]|uniref:Gylcosyl hydrolase 115 C-terminal domain-containing protein n=1 Tax=Neotamlana nanhaiensis TaxID=1382798 RepID=A0A0D7W753_9FLAO|nr:hypothetical protein PK35_02870 [Tamlana nanhaiensis]